MDNLPEARTLSTSGLAIAVAMSANVSLFFRPKAVVAAGIVALLAAGGGCLYWFWHRPLTTAPEVYTMKPGTTLRGLARELHERGVVSHPAAITWLGYITGRSRELKAGEYRFRAGINAVELLDQVVAGHVIEYPLVLVEGWNFRQVMRAVETAPKLEHTLAGLTPPEIMARLGHPDVHAEGRFFPDTYYYTRGDADKQILAAAFERMQKILSRQWSDRASGLPFETMGQALTLASIIEKETSREDERRLIAGVFVNRLRRGMRLQSDPTVIYGLGERFDGNLHRRDLHTDTAYNTYTRRGLPPTPIAMPGRQSLAAALHPANTSALYFVARGDGSHVFSSTFAEHAAAVAKYQLGESVGRSASASGEKETGASKRARHD